MDAELRSSLLQLIRKKFASYENVTILADDIVHDAYVKVRSSRNYTADKENYGYLSVVCIRLAYRRFMAQAADFTQIYLDAEGTPLLDESDIVDEIIKEDDTYAVLESLKTLRDIERVVVTQRYYNDFTFAKIADNNGIKLNTVLSHHRRALAKLRPQLTKLLGYKKEQSYEQNIMEDRPHRRTAVDTCDTVRHASRGACQ